MPKFSKRTVKAVDRFVRDVEKKADQPTAILHVPGGKKLRVKLPKRKPMTDQQMREWESYKQWLTVKPLPDTIIKP